MKVVSALDDVVIPAGGSVVTIGVFDGVHLGHRAVLARVAAMARAREAASVLVSLDRHPASVLRPDSAPKLLCDLDQRLELLEATGTVDVAVVLPFGLTEASEEPEDFIERVLVGSLRAVAVVVGTNFGFGRRRRGDVAMLVDHGRRRGFAVEGFDLVPGYSSTAVRALLAAGQVEEAAAILGRQHEVRGQVVAGDRRGRTLGFPTANLGVPANLALPAVGIYAGWYTRPGGQRHGAAISVGRRATYYGPEAAVVTEAHLIGFSGDLYGEAARLSFAARLHDELVFTTEAALAQAISADVEVTRRILGLPATPEA
ncbi:MAG: riboflavin biosynthesis protein RibF [Acidimicrobiales bacterium]